MNERLKNRITGVIVIILLAVIVTPILFKGSGQKVLKFKEISGQKDIFFKYVDEVEKLNKNKNIEIISKGLDTKIVSIENLNKAKEYKSEKKIWMIKIGSYLKKVNAENQMQDLIEKKHQSFILKSDKDNKNSNNFDLFELDNLNNKIDFVRMRAKAGLNCFQKKIF